MAEPDELFTLKNQFYVGNYRNAVSEGSMLGHLSEAMQSERDLYVLRAQLALGQTDQVLGAIPESTSSVALSALRLFATFLSGQADPEMVELTLNEWQQDPSSAENPHLLLFAGIMFLKMNKLSNALSMLTRGGGLEHKLYMVNLYLQMERSDLALKIVAEMQQMEEDSTLTQLAHAWCLVQRGGEAADEATMHFQELGDRFGTTPLLLNGAAAAYMALNNYVEAERLLMEAFDKDSSNEDTLLNLIVVNTHLNKPTDTYLSRLEQQNPSNAWVTNYRQLEADFERLAAGFA